MKGAVVLAMAILDQYVTFDSDSDVTRFDVTVLNEIDKTLNAPYLSMESIGTREKS
jgi:hypothetical protein